MTTTAWKMRWLCFAFIVGSLFLIFYGFHVAQTAGDCVNSVCHGGSGAPFLILGFVGFFVSCNLFIYSNNIVSAVDGRVIRENGRDATATVLTVV